MRRRTRSTASRPSLRAQAGWPSPPSIPTTGSPFATSTSARVRSDFGASVASAASGGSIELHLDALDGTLIGTCEVASTGGEETWTTTSCDVSGAEGVHDLYLKFGGTGSNLFNLDYWQFTSVDGGSGGAGGGGAGGAAAEQYRRRMWRCRVEVQGTSAGTGAGASGWSGRQPVGGSGAGCDGRNAASTGGSGAPSGSFLEPRRMAAAAEPVRGGASAPLVRGGPRRPRRTGLEAPAARAPESAADRRSPRGRRKTSPPERGSVASSPSAEPDHPPSFLGARTRTSGRALAREG